jgi:hypothetical protein
MEVRKSEEIIAVIEQFQKEIDFLSVEIAYAEREKFTPSLINVLKLDKERRVGKVEVLKWVLFV